MAEVFNNWLDNLISVAWRLLDLPLYVLVIFLVSFFSIGVWYWVKLRKGAFTVKSVVVLLICIVVPAAMLADLKFKQLKLEAELLNNKYQQALAAPDQAASATPLVSDPVLQNMRRYLPELSIWQRDVHPAVTLLTCKKADPEAVFHCAVIDMAFPGVLPKVTPEYTDWKTHTSAFAREHGLLVAINGEAGNSQHQGSGYGEWVGTWVSNGVPITLLDTDKRPFIWFDRSNKVHYSPEAEVVQEMHEELYNAIWGRFDILVEGTLVGDHGDRPYSRTVMGLDGPGSTLFLLIVDGKRPGYSLGLSLPECAKFLRDLGAHHAMACDQGGSSCMYLGTVDAIVNRPADMSGIERPVYTHFGIKVQ